MTDRRKVLGRWGEDSAARYLSAAGYRILDRNVRSAHGEIDIVALLDGVLVFVEVRTRSSHAFAFPEESVNLRKQAHLLSAAEEYIQAHPEVGENWRFDVIAVEGAPGSEPRLEHFENAFG